MKVTPVHTQPELQKRAEGTPMGQALGVRAQAGESPRRPCPGEECRAWRLETPRARLQTPDVHGLSSSSLTPEPGTGLGAQACRAKGVGLENNGLLEHRKERPFSPTSVLRTPNDKVVSGDRALATGPQLNFKSSGGRHLASLRPFQSHLSRGRASRPGAQISGQNSDPHPGDKKEGSSGI